MQSEAISILQSEKERFGGSALSGMLLVGGTSIGAGMLALPVVTGIAGFLPAMVVNTLCWLFMLSTGLLLLEVTLWMEDGSNLLSMAKRFLGTAGKFIGGAFFIFLYYCLLVSYIDGGTTLLVDATMRWTGLELTGFLGYLFFAATFGFIIYFGHKVIDRVNWVLMVSLIVSYFLLICVGSTEVVTDYLVRKEWGLTLVAAPILFSAYGYHNIIPSMTSYLKRNVNKLRLAIICGTAIPFIVYSLWQWMIIGSLEQGDIASAAANQEPITKALQSIVGNPWVSFFGGYFGFFALVTSFLGVSLSMVDFFADGLKISREGVNRLWLCVMVFLPPVIFAALNPGIFLQALGIAGGFGEAILNGLFPIAMVWVGRYHMKLSSEYTVPGGRFLLGVLTLFTFIIIGIEIQHLFF
ncbi:MAG: amino acid permease [Waddliaceae bacterium]